MPKTKDHVRFKIIFSPLEDKEPPLHLLQMAEEGGSFDFLKEKEEDIYSAEDGEAL